MDIVFNIQDLSGESPKWSNYFTNMSQNEFRASEKVNKDCSVVLLNPQYFR